MNKEKLFMIIGIIAIIIVVVLTFPKQNPDNGIDEGLIKCIANNSVIYVSTGCSACAAQKKIFGEDFAKLNAVDCAVEPDKCKSGVFIEYVPTWVIKNEKYVGVKSIEELKLLTGC